MSPDEIQLRQLVALERIASVRGTYLVNDAVAVAKDFSEFFVCEDTIIASLLENGDNFLVTPGGGEVKSKYIADPAIALKAGTIVTCNNGKFTGITLTSGSVNLILL